MSAFQKKLLPDERIIFLTKKHIIIFTLPVIWTLATIFLWALPNAIFNKIAYIPGIFALFSWINAYINYSVSHFAVTTKRILMTEGFLTKHTNETRLVTVANVSVNQSLMGQIFNYGTVILHAFGGDKDPFMLIASPNEFQRQLQMQLDKVVKH